MFYCTPMIIMQTDIEQRMLAYQRECDARSEIAIRQAVSCIH